MSILLNYVFPICLPSLLVVIFCRWAFGVIDSRTSINDGGYVIANSPECK